MVHAGVPHPESIITAEGVFDGKTARRVEAALLSAPPEDHVLVDLTKIREFEDFGIAVLARALAACRADVKLRGLRQHQVRVLAHFGIDAGPVERAVLPEGI